jgi:hypothetical protein
MRYIGDPEEAALRYYRLNFADADQAEPHAAGASIPDVHARVVNAWIEDEAAERIENVEQGKPILLNVEVEAREDLEQPTFGFHFLNADGVHVFGFNTTLSVDASERDCVPAGRRVHVSGRIENPLVPGRYSVSCWISRNRVQGDMALQHVRLLDFVVYGTRPSPGLVAVDAQFEAAIEPAGERAG